MTDSSSPGAFGGLPRPFWIITIGTFVNRAGWFVMPFLAIYLTDGLHLTSSEAGLVVSFVGGGLALGGAIGGSMADRFGRRSTMLVGLVGGAGVLLLLGTSRGVVLIASVAALWGMTSGTYMPASAAFVADVVPAKDRARAYGLVYWAGNAGCSVGNALAGILSGFGFYWLFWGDAGTTLLFAAAVFLLVGETRPEAKQAAAVPQATFADVLRDRVFAVFLVLAFVFWFIFHQSLVTLALDMRGQGMSPTAYGSVLALNGLVIVLLQPFTTSWLAKFKSELVLAGAMLLTGIGFALNVVAHTPFLYGVGVVIWTIGEIAFAPRASAIVAELAPANMRGRYQGAYALAAQTSLLAGPWVGAAVWEHVGREALWLGMFGLAVLAGITHLAIAPARHRRLASARAAAAAAQT